MDYNAVNILHNTTPEEGTPRKCAAGSESYAAGSSAVATDHLMAVCYLVRQHLK